MTTMTITGKASPKLQTIGFLLRIIGPSIVVIATATKLLIGGRDALSICVFIGVVLYCAGYIIKRYF